jgi:hypothetical protein
MTMVISGSDGVTFPDSTNQFSGGAFSFKNRIINGDMRIAQRGTSGTPTSGGAYVSVDRWNARAATSTGHTAAQSTTSATGFTNSLLFTTGTGASPAAGDRNWLRQSIEGFNIADLAWGTANAKTITVSFQVRSSLTGTFAAAIVNDAGDRAWPFTFTISSANTFESKSTTITGPTDGTWGSGNGVGLALSFDMGCGSDYEGTAGQWNTSNKLTVSGATKVIATNGATFYITGVQLEVGSVATPFERRPFGTELALCQRYYYKIQTTAANQDFGNGYNITTTNSDGNCVFKVSMRTGPTALETTGTATDYRIRNLATITICSSIPQILGTGTTESCGVRFIVASGLTAGGGAILRSETSSAYLAWSAEL